MTEEKRKAGRPTGTTKDNNKIRKSIRFSEDEYNLIKEKAASLKMTISAYIRLKALGE